MSLTLRNVSKLAPFAQVLIYTLMPSGEVVADSWDYPVQRCLNNQVLTRQRSGTRGKLDLNLVASNLAKFCLKLSPKLICRVLCCVSLAQVALKFSSLEQLPAERTSLNLQAHPGSLCSVRAIDQSVLLLQTEQELTASYVRRTYTQLTALHS